MNRKLVNGLLLLSIATVGCGTFTSCKDTDEDVQAGYNKEIASVYKDLLDKINACKDNCGPNVKKNLEQIAQWLGGNIDAEGNLTLPSTFDAKVLESLKDALETEDVAKIVPALQNLQAQLNQQITSIELNQTYNPVFGTLNLPTGLQTNVLAGYFGTTDADLSFPDFNADEAEVGSKEAFVVAGKANLTPKNEKAVIKAGKVYMDGDGFLGNAYLTINPINTNTVPTLELIKSTGAVAPVVLKTDPSNDELKFGWTRASEFNNGLYKSVATIDPEKASEIAIVLKPEFKSAVKNILKDPSKGTLTKLGSALLDQMNGILPAYGFKAAYDASAFGYTYDEATGKWTVAEPENTPAKNYIVSKYELAATTIHPLGYNSLADLTTSKRLPTFSPLNEILDKLFDDLKDDLDFKLDITPVEKLDIKFEISKFEVENQYLKITIPAITVGNDHSDPFDIYLTYDKGTGTVDIPAGSTVQAGALNDLISSITDSVNKMLSDETNPNSIKNQVENNIIAKVNAMVDDINAMLVGNDQKPGINGQINSQVKDILANIQNQLSGKLGSAQKLLDMYNKLAEKVNAYLEDPHGHMQVAMAYMDANGAPHMLSTDKNVPSVFSGNGDAIELFATSYTADIAAPSYKKYVAVVEASDNDITTVNEKSTYLNTVISGRQHIVDMTGFKKGVTYTIVYSSLDYRGNTSTRLYYLTVK